jgi:hypothetical protein
MSLEAGAFPWDIQHISVLPEISNLGMLQEYRLLQRCGPRLGKPDMQDKLLIGKQAFFVPRHDCCT